MMPTRKQHICLSSIPLPARIFP